MAGFDNVERRAVIFASKIALSITVGVEQLAMSAALRAISAPTPWHSLERWEMTARQKMAETAWRKQLKSLYPC